MDKSPLTGTSPNCLSQEIDPPCRFCERGEFGLCVNASAGVGSRGVGGGWGDGYTCHETEAFLCPPELSDDQAVLVEPMSVALHAVLQRPPNELDKVLIVGAGQMGLLTLQVVRAVSPDCFVAVVAKYPDQAAAARRFGANEIVGPGDRYAQAAKLTGATRFTAPLHRGMLLGGFDLVYDCVGTSQTLTDSLRWVRAAGLVVMIGIEWNFMKVDLSPVWYQEVDLIGSKGHGTDEWQGRRRHTYEWVVDLIRQGKLCHDAFHLRRFRLEDHKQAVAAATSKASATLTKVVFEYS
jgi:threonine dehydrogenase-like Zn-dependent dehydrogenase